MARKVDVLIVDDDENYVTSTVDLLSEKGFQCVGVYSGHEAIDIIKDKNFDVILLDIKMPILNGVETFKEIKKICPDVMVIMVTAYRVEEMIKEALKEGVYTVLIKPLDTDRIVNTIQRSKKGGALVMVVDDNPNFSQTIKDNLEARGFVVNTACSDEEAINKARERPHDIFIIDAKVPPVNGLIIYLELKKVNPDAVAIMMTAYKEEMSHIIEQAINKGVYAAIYKPFSIDKIVKMIEEIVEKRRKENGKKGKEL